MLSQVPNSPPEPVTQSLPLDPATPSSLSPDPVTLSQPPDPATSFLPPIRLALAYWLLVLSSHS